MKRPHLIRNILADAFYIAVLFAVLWFGLVVTP